MEIIETEEVKEDKEKERCLFTFSQKVSIFFWFFCGKTFTRVFGESLR